MSDLAARRCQRCREVIPPARVRALPDTRLCLPCSQEIGGDYHVMVIPENLSKSGSMKRNYGAWTLKRTPRRIRPKPAPEPRAE